MKTEPAKGMTALRDKQLSAADHVIAALRTCEGMERLSFSRSIVADAIGQALDLGPVEATAQPAKITAEMATAPTKDDCHMLDAIMKAAKQIHSEFDCLSDHVMTAKQIRKQIAAIIWKHVDRRKR